MQYSIRKIQKKVGQQFQDVTCVCASDGEILSIIAEIHDHSICEEHGTPEQWAKKLILALEKLDAA